MRIRTSVSLMVMWLAVFACKNKDGVVFPDAGSGGARAETGGQVGTGGVTGAGGAATDVAAAGGERAGGMPGTMEDAGATGDAGGTGDAGPMGPSLGFALGVEYTEQGLAQPFGAAGIRWAKTRLEAFSWGAIEPAAPVGAVHTYNWSCTDRLITEYQNAGMVNIQSYLTPKSGWASKSATDVMPKPEHIDHYQAWIAAMFERYDGDGKDDLPGLKRPVQNWVVGGEWTGFWGSGNADDYIALAAATAKAGRAAYPGVRLGAIPFMMWDVFMGDEPSDAEIAARLIDPPPVWRNSTSGMMKILDRGDLFDEISLHSLGDYTELPPTLRWVQTQMAARGYDKPVFIDDAFPIAFLVSNRAGGGAIGWPSVHPVSTTDQRAVYDLLRAVATRQAGKYEAAKAWIDGEVAKSVIKKIVTARAEGYAGIQIGNTEDWMHDTLPALRDGTFNLIGASAMMGLIEVTHSAGYGVCQTRTPGAARPALYNLGLLVEKLGPSLEGTVQKFSAPALDSARVFQFTRPDGHQVWIAWNEPRRLVLPGQADPPVATHVQLPNARVRITRAATALPVDRPSLESETTLDGTASVEVTTVPIFIEPLP